MADTSNSDLEKATTTAVNRITHCIHTLFLKKRVQTLKDACNTDVRARRIRFFQEFYDLPTNSEFSIKPAGSQKELRAIKHFITTVEAILCSAYCCYSLSVFRVDFL